MTGWYVQCANDACHGTHFAVVRDNEGEIQRLECAQCGGQQVVQQRKAPPARPGAAR
jgi:hypothetical protein